ncbi:hypothetical protein [Streptomyces sp. NPDC007991]|uniref:hypothetical protein n=1 Tax=Streptomyces sp. NPDC007991 TaxID=3364803 RepID=UPI0036E03874
MGEQQNGGGFPGRRRVHPGGSAYDHRAARDADGRLPGHRGSAGLDHPGLAARHVLDEAELEALLVAALVRDGIDAEAEQRAVAAFVAARDAGAYGARTRRRDDWRPRERRYPGRSLKATLSVLLASLTLGGVAFAAIGSAGSTDGADERGRPPASTRAPGAPDESAGTPSGSASARPDGPAASRDTEAHCRAYEEVDGRGEALGATAWKRLVQAAGGERNVTAFCAEQLARAEAKPGSTARPEKGDPGSAGAGNGSDNADNRAGNADSGAGNAENGSGNAGSGTGNADSGAGNVDSGAGNAENGSGAAHSGDGADGTASGAEGKPAQPSDRRP